MARSTCSIQGTIEAFLIFIDRVAFILPLVAALYFRMYELGVLVFGTFAVGVISLLILTTQNRYGFSVALDYLVRARWPEASDPGEGSLTAPASSAD